MNGRELDTTDIPVRLGSGVGPVEFTALPDTNTYQRDITIIDREVTAFEAAYLQRHDFHGDWTTP